MNIHIKNIDQNLINEISSISLAMFRKSFFGVFHGSISARISQNRFLINKKDAIFDRINNDSLIMLHDKEDYRWQEASIDSFIHSNIYQSLTEARFAVYAMPPYSVAYSLKHSVLLPKDYFGYRFLGKQIDIFDPKDYDSWYERADIDILRYFKQSKKNFIFIRGYGIYAYHRDLHALAKIIALIENSCKVLYLGGMLDAGYINEGRFDIG
ncbi:class II aldolase and adducin N-terminal domain-containing protein [Helicobacter sp. 11S03491-1]|uniref:class II aldolase and adducin N-terminal domain-containing protein n=1 Tax=Helicobacter sp. 11S03491-1 TaxID=1476196 RepID=UPI000BA79390|nr:class II aldolase and adducin N-terminal domain-containing protein [Helicobacter sp. 11S03491-1]PAF43759.1 hypothetical protein BKH45_00385 [Helicobacter sp. 11S03491-1]